MSAFRSRLDRALPRPSSSIASPRRKFSWPKSPKENQRMKVCIYGAGAIGGYLAAGLSEVDGVELSLIARGPHLAAIRENGLKLLIGGKEKVCKPKATKYPVDLGQQDYVIVCLKAHQAWESAEDMRPLLGPHTTVVTGQNGVPWWYPYGLGSKFADMRLASVDPDGRQWK